MDENTTFFQTSAFVFHGSHSVTDPRRILSCFRAVVLLLLASCVFLVFYLTVLAGLLVFSCRLPFWESGFLAAESGVWEHLEHRLKGIFIVEATCKQEEIRWGSLQVSTRVFIMSRRPRRSVKTCFAEESRVASFGISGRTCEPFP